MVNVNLLKAETIKRGFKDKDIAEKALGISHQAYLKKLRKESNPLLALIKSLRR